MWIKVKPINKRDIVAINTDYITSIQREFDINTNKEISCIIRFSDGEHESLNILASELINLIMEGNNMKAEIIDGDFVWYDSDYRGNKYIAAYWTKEFIKQNKEQIKMLIKYLNSTLEEVDHER